VRRRWLQAEPNVDVGEEHGRGIHEHDVVVLAPDDQLLEAALPLPRPLFPARYQTIRVSPSSSTRTTDSRAAPGHPG